MIKTTVDTLTHSKRKTVTFAGLRRMQVGSLDKLPGPVEFRGMVGRKMVRLRKRWVGFGWEDEGTEDGTEPVLCLDDTVGGA